MEAHHNCFIGTSRGFPDVEIETVFAHVRVRIPQIDELVLERGVYSLVAGCWKLGCVVLRVIGRR